MSRNLYDAIQHICKSYSGDASQIWRDKPSSAELVWRFLEFPGVGPKIATMATNILARQFKVPLRDYYSVDISADIHIRRVFARLGLIEPGASAERVSFRARALYPEFLGLLDHPLWEIGRNWCRPRHPKCEQCYLSPHCPSAESDG
jgi:endonuclease-3